MAEQQGLQHTSVGQGEARQLLLGHPRQPLQVCPSTDVLLAYKFQTWR